MYLILKSSTQNRANNSITSCIFGETLAQDICTRKFTDSIVSNSKTRGKNHNLHWHALEQKQTSYTAGRRVSWYNQWRTMWHYQMPFSR